MPTYKYQYAAKFICTSHIQGTSQTAAIDINGHYTTVVEIHNPHTRPIRFRRKLANTGIISNYFEESLDPDGVFMVACGSISSFDIHPVHGFEGFLVIESTDSLDVIGMYGAGHGQSGIASIAVERVPERKLHG